MARYTDSVCRLCRREGLKLFLKGARCYTDKCAIERRNYPPGEHGQGRSRFSEYRLQLREDNADLRLTEKGRDLCLVDDHRWRRFVEKRDAIESERQRLNGIWISPGSDFALSLATLRPATRKVSRGA